MEQPQATTPTTAQPAATPEPIIPVRAVEPHSKGDLSATEAQTAAEFLKAEHLAGKLSGEALERNLAQLGMTSAAVLAPDPRSDEAKQLEAAGYVPAKPQDFTVQWSRPGEEVPMTPELKAADSHVRTWLSTAEFDRGLGNSLVSTVSKVVQQVQGMSARQLESWGESQYELLKAAHGDKLEERLNAAGRMVAELDKKQPGLKQLMARVGDSALVANMLMDQAERYWARRKK